MPSGLLPAGFEELEPFIVSWDLPTTQARWDQRCASTMVEVVSFYEIMLEKAPAAVEHLKQYSLDELPEPESRLLRLCLALAHASIAVEVLGRPIVPFTPQPHGIQMVRGPAHWG